VVKSKKEIIQILATKYNLPLEKVEKIVNSQFKYVAKVMAEGNFDAIRLPYFGKFYSKKERRDILNGTTGDS
jgi:nucleoid DNA-binding protein